MNSIPKLLKDISANLRINNWQLVTAESCTGGLLASLVTEIPGSSRWFERGFVTYSNLAKQELLCVPSLVLEEFGAVSEAVAGAMASGALKQSAGQIAVSITGIAGPDGGSPAKPVGTVCFGWVTQGMACAITATKQFTGTRHDIRMAACHEALSGILLLLKV